MLRLFLLTCLCVPGVAADDISGLRWMTGCWEMRLGSARIEEQWTTPDGGIMLGVGRTIKNGRAVSHEFLRIAPEKGALVYTAQIGTPGVTGFRLLRSSADEVVFENPAHDFPQRILYRKAGDSLLARIEGLDKGKPRHEEFPYKRAACQ